MFLNKIFAPKSNRSKGPASSSIKDTLTQTQINCALVYYTKHKNHVDEIVKLTGISFEPSQIEDKNDPMLWKDPH